MRMSKMAGAPPQMIGAPGWASWWMVIPLRHSAACCTTEPSKVTGAAAPASGMETIWTGTKARPRSIRFCAPNSLQISGGDGHTSKTACGFFSNPARPPAKIASMSIIAWSVSTEKAPVTIGFLEYSSTRYKRYRSPIALGISLHTTAVDWASYCGSISAILMIRTRSAEYEGLCSSVSGSRT